MNGEVGSGKNPQRNILLVGPKSDDHQIEIGILKSTSRSYFKRDRFLDPLSLDYANQALRLNNAKIPLARGQQRGNLIDAIGADLIGYQDGRDTAVILFKCAFNDRFADGRAGAIH